MLTGGRHESQRSRLLCPMGDVLTLFSLSSSEKLSKICDYQRHPAAPAPLKLASCPVTGSFTPMAKIFQKGNTFVRKNPDSAWSQGVGSSTTTGALGVSSSNSAPVDDPIVQLRGWNTPSIASSSNATTNPLIQTSCHRWRMQLEQKS